MRDFLDSGLLELIGIVLVLVIIGAFVAFYLAFDLYPESGKVLLQLSNKYGHCRVAYENESGERRSVEMYIEDCVKAEVGALCTFGVNRVRVAHNVLCKKQEPQ